MRHPRKAKIKIRHRSSGSCEQKRQLCKQYDCKSIRRITTMAEMLMNTQMMEFVLNPLDCLANKLFVHELIQQLTRGWPVVRLNSLSYVDVLARPQQVVGLVGERQVARVAALPAVAI